MPKTSPITAYKALAQQGMAMSKTSPMKAPRAS